MKMIRYGLGRRASALELAGTDIAAVAAGSDVMAAATCVTPAAVDVGHDCSGGDRVGESDVGCRRGVGSMARLGVSKRSNRIPAIA